jgi:hypothetical protein
MRVGELRQTVFHEPRVTFTEAGCDLYYIQFFTTIFSNDDRCDYVNWIYLAKCRVVASTLENFVLLRNGEFEGQNILSPFIIMPLQIVGQ